MPPKKRFGGSPGTKQTQSKKRKEVETCPSVVPSRARTTCLASHVDDGQALIKRERRSVRLQIEKELAEKSLDRRPKVFVHAGLTSRIHIRPTSYVNHNISIHACTSSLMYGRMYEHNHASQVCIPSLSHHNGQLTGRAINRLVPPRMD